MANKTENTKIIRWGILGCGDVTELKSGPAYQKTEGPASAEILSVPIKTSKKIRF